MKRLIPEDSVYQSWLLIRRVRHTILNVRQKELEPYSITYGQANLLFIINELGETATFTEIGKYINRKANSLSVQIKRMERDGLLKRIRCKPKSTLTRFELTEKGLELFDVTREPKSITEIFMKLSEADHQQLSSILRKILHEANRKLRTM